jgi:hypothetical protein
MADNILSLLKGFRQQKVIVTTTVVVGNDIDSNVFHFNTSISPLKFYNTIETENKELKEKLNVADFRLKVTSFFAKWAYETYCYSSLVNSYKLGFVDEEYFNDNVKKFAKRKTVANVDDVVFAIKIIQCSMQMSFSAAEYSSLLSCKIDCVEQALTLIKENSELNSVNKNVKNIQ